MNFQYFGKNQLYLKQLHKYCTEKVAFIGLDYSYHINNNSSFFYTCLAKFSILEQKIQ